MKRRPYFINTLLGLDTLSATLFGIPYPITISAWCYFKKIRWAIAIINFIFNDKEHCKNSVDEVEIAKYY